MIQLSENASNQIVKLLAKHEIPGGGLRVAIKAGGCSGFEYVFAWETAPRDGDQVFDGAGGARIFVDPKSLRLLDGTVLDFDTGLLSKGFMLNNPNATGTCGCGHSFSA
jgi:iron-sulfur cluster assembly protein